MAQDIHTVLVNFFDEMRRNCFL